MQINVVILSQNFLNTAELFLCLNRNKPHLFCLCSSVNKPLQSSSVVRVCIHTHYAGGELLVCDVQRVSVSVKPPLCPVLTWPLPVFQVRHLPGLKKTLLFESPFTPNSVALCLSQTHHFLCFYFPFSALHLPGSYVWRRAPAVFGPRWSWWDMKPLTASLLCRRLG